MNPRIGIIRRGECNKLRCKSFSEPGKNTANIRHPLPGSVIQKAGGCGRGQREPRKDKACQGMPTLAASPAKNCRSRPSGLAAGGNVRGRVSDARACHIRQSENFHKKTKACQTVAGAARASRPRKTSERRERQRQRRGTLFPAPRAGGRPCVEGNADLTSRLRLNR